MRGKRNETHSVRYLGHKYLEECFAKGKGTSKHKDKREDPSAMKGKVYMDSTLSQYHTRWDDYCDSMKDAGFTVNGHFPRTLEEAAEYMDDYILELEARPGARPGTTFSAWSVRAYFAAAGKVLGLSAKDYALPARCRKDITRSRGEAVRDKHFSAEKNEELVNFCRCTGLRNFKELQMVRGSALIDHGDGTYYLKVLGKGGYLRTSRIFGTPEQVQRVVERLKSAGDQLVWPHVHSGADIHALRGEYAFQLYKAYERDPSKLPPSERYCCRKDMSGIWLDRKAMQIASNELGHHRINVIAEHYLWRLANEQE